MRGRIETVSTRQNSKHALGKRLSSIFGRTNKKDLGIKNKNTEPEVYWPLDLLPLDFPKVRILTYGYDSHITNWFKGPAMQLDIFSYGESLLNGLEARRREEAERPLIFIVHSLGGLILKDVGV